MNFTIRIACPADVAAMHRIRRAVRENTLTDPGRVTEASYAPYIAAGTAWVVVAGTCEIAGFAVLDSTDASVWALFVAPRHEHAGAGRMLIDSLCDDATLRGLAALWLVTANGTRAEHFYRRAGWVATAADDPRETRFEKALIR